MRMIRIVVLNRRWPSGIKNYRMSEINKVEIESEKQTPKMVYKLNKNLPKWFCFG